MSSAIESFELGLKEKNSIHLELGTRKCSTGQISKRKFRLFRCRRQFFLTEKLSISQKNVRCRTNAVSRSIGHFSMMWQKYDRDTRMTRYLRANCQGSVR